MDAVDNPFWWKHAEKWVGFREVATSDTEWGGFESVLLACLNRHYFHEDVEALRLFLESVGLVAPPQPIVITPKPAIARLPTPTLVVGEGVAHMCDESDLPHRFWSRDKKNKWAFNRTLIRHTLSR
jgi:hypothetical protein